MKQNSLSAGIVPVYLSDDGASDKEPLFLLLRCYRYWDFPKGGVHTNEEPLRAAARELEEETGLNKMNLQCGATFKDTPVYSKGKVARYFIARVDREDVELRINPELGHAEHQEFRWVTYTQGTRLLNERVLAILDWAHQVVTDSTVAPTVTLTMK